MKLPVIDGRFAIGVIVVIGFFGILIFGLLKGMPDSPGLNLLIGSLIGAFGVVTQWYYGSSSGSAAKDATIATLKATGPVAPAPVEPPK